MQVREERRNPIVDLRAVLHGAGAERVHARVDGVVELGEVREMAHHLRLAELGQTEWHASAEPGRDLRVGLFASAHVAASAALFVDLDEQRLERGHGGLHARFWNDLRADGHRAVTVSRTPAATPSIAATSASISASVVISVHWMIRSSRSP